MHKLGVLGALCVTAKISFSVATAAAAGIGPLSGVPGSGAPGPDHAVVFVAGMGGGAGGMGGGGAGMGGSGGGMGGGGFGGMGGGAGMRGAPFGDPFLGPSQDSGQAAENASGVGAPSADYTYQCVTPARRCPFVAPASLRSNSLRSGAECVCPDGQSRGRIE